ncbi:uncharacterized protein LOC107829100 isoform X2 [Nicotiana tabacum]|uniref:Uncharacterized protein LOC107829100 isoform X2 n=2 Tax=Nicotiana TaxID=4085 RepID=A0A1S4DFA6_TOBAC|nr:PREDICTED: uncharacterized protein LOC104222210 isoform X2 [Nicotiana sylvestris]XP_016512021.1 PREDICTED: uncharacterized protein LOC107829100 isoform X2 [Nicotiana tabacum]
MFRDSAAYIGGLASEFLILHLGSNWFDKSSPINLPHSKVRHLKNSLLSEEDESLVLDSDFLVPMKGCQLKRIWNCLFSNTQNMSADEKSLWTRVNSLCCLLQKDPITVNKSENCVDVAVGGKN